MTSESYMSGIADERKEKFSMILIPLQTEIQRSWLSAQFFLEGKVEKIIFSEDNKLDLM